MHHLQHGGHEEQQPAQRRVDDERHRVGRGELPGPEQAQRQHRLLFPGLDQDEQAEQEQARAERHQHGDRPPAVGRRRDQPVGDPGQRAADGQRAGDVESRHRTGRLGLRHVLSGDGYHHRGQRQVDEEHQPPGHRVDQPPAKKRAYGGGHAAEARPRADGGHPVILGEGGLQDGQAARGQQRPADALQGARRDQHPGARRHPAQQRRGGEPDDADHEHLAPAVAVPERAAEQQQPGQGQRVGVDDPLQAGSRRCGIPGRWRAARCRPRSRRARPCPSRARWRPPPTGPARWTGAGPGSPPLFRS